MRYASQTRVTIANSKIDIQELLAKHGATGFAYATGATACWCVQHAGTARGIMLVMPSPDDYAERRTIADAPWQQRDRHESGLFDRVEGVAAVRGGQS